jgi:geranylgeranylglycerol-phosphate geranylgeranyltransferase
MEDVEGDMHEGIISVSSKYGFETAFNTIITLSVLLILFTFYPYLNGNYNIYYIAIILIFVIPVLIYFLISLLKDKSSKNLNKLSFLLKLDMVFGLIAVYVGR